MKILIATYWPLPTAGGIWRYVQDLRNELTRLGHDVDVLAQHPSRKKYYLLYSGKSISKTTIKEQIANSFKLPFHLPRQDLSTILYFEEERYCFEAAAAYFEVHSYEMIHTQDIISTIAISRVKPQSVPLIATIHGCRLTEYLIQVKKAVTDADLDVMKQSVVSQYLAVEESAGILASHKTIVPSRWLKNLFISDYAVPDDHVDVIPYGFDFEDFLQKASLPVALPPNSSKFIIGCVARLDRVKGHKNLLEALAKLKQDRQDWVCWLIGDGMLRRELEMTIHQLQLKDNIVLLGNRADVPALVKQMNLFVLPSLQDNQPFAVIEAQALGTPVIVTDAGGIPEMVSHLKTGMISPKGNSHQLYETIKTAMDSEVLRNRIGREAKDQAIKVWSNKKSWNQVWKVYNKFLFGFGGIQHEE